MILQSPTAFLTLCLFLLTVLCRWLFGTQVGSIMNQRSDFSLSLSGCLFKLRSVCLFFGHLSSPSDFVPRRPYAVDNTLKSENKLTPSVSPTLPNSVCLLSVRLWSLPLPPPLIFLVLTFSHHLSFHPYFLSSAFPFVSSPPTSLIFPSNWHILSCFTVVAVCAADNVHHHNVHICFRHEGMGSPGGGVFIQCTKLQQCHSLCFGKGDLFYGFIFSLIIFTILLVCLRENWVMFPYLG